MQGAAGDQGGSHADAIALAAPIWASLPGAGYGQWGHALANLLEIYEDERAAEPCAEQDPGRNFHGS